MSDEIEVYFYLRQAFFIACFFVVHAHGYQSTGIIIQCVAGTNIELKNKKSYAVSFILRDDMKTMTDKNIDKIMNNLIKAFENELNAQIR